MDEFVHNAVKSISDEASTEYCTTKQQVLFSDTVERVLSISMRADHRFDEKIREQRELRIPHTWHQIKTGEQITELEQSRLLQTLRDPYTIEWIKENILPNIHVQQSDKNKKFIRSYLENPRTGNYTIGHLLVDMIELIERYDNIVPYSDVVLTTNICDTPPEEDDKAA